MEATQKSLTTLYITFIYISDFIPLFDMKRVKFSVGSMSQLSVITKKKSPQILFSEKNEKSEKKFIKFFYKK